MSKDQDYVLKTREEAHAVLEKYREKYDPTVLDPYIEAMADSIDRGILDIHSATSGVTSPLPKFLYIMGNHELIDNEEADKLIVEMGREQEEKFPETLPPLNSYIPVPADAPARSKDEVPDFG